MVGEMQRFEALLQRKVSEKKLAIGPPESSFASQGQRHQRAWPPSCQLEGCQRIALPDRAARGQRSATRGPGHKRAGLGHQRAGPQEGQARPGRKRAKPGCQRAGPPERAARVSVRKRGRPPQGQAFDIGGRQWAGRKRDKPSTQGGDKGGREWAGRKRLGKEPRVRHTQEVATRPPKARQGEICSWHTHQRLGKEPQNKDPQVAIKQIPLDFEQFLSRCRLERQRRQQPQSFEITPGLSVYISDNVDESPSHWCVHESKVEEMSTFVTIKPNIHGYKLDLFSWACEFATIGFYSSLGVQSKETYNFVVKPNRTNIFERPRVCKKFKHTGAYVQGVINPYQKPQLLMMYLIDLLSMSGEWIMDLFAGTVTTTISALKRGRNVIAVECDPLQVKIIEQRVTTLKELPDEFQEVEMKSMASDPRFFDASREPQPLIGSEKVREITDLVDFEPDNVEVEEQASDISLQITSTGEETRNEEEEDLPIQA
ncbi:hypothetical protein L7F22_055778 [Adiantum nelumboides]|nr:hypothetical protein [Adiantum nelumboides]